MRTKLLSVMGSNSPIIRKQMSRGYSKVQHLCRKASAKLVNINPKLDDCLGYYDRVLEMWVYRWYSEPNVTGD